MLQRAQSLAAQGDWEIASATFGRVVGSSDPNLHVAALLGLAECRYRSDDEPGALQAWISATQVETPLTWRAWKALAAARVRSGDLPGAARAYREAERRAPAQERPEIASRLGWLNKEMGDRGAADRYFARSRTGGVQPPVVTWAILAVTAAIGVASLLSPRLDELFLDWFALDKVAVLQGELWRLLTVVLVHGGMLHLLFNMYALWIIGPIVEALYGRVRFAFIYGLCAVAGSTASFVFSDARLSVGASGAIFGLFGVLLVADRVHKPALTRGARSLTAQIGMLVAVNLVIGFAVPGIDNAAHVGGLLAGLWLGFVLVPQGATTLRSLWSAPAGTPAGAGPVPLLRALAVLALVGVVALGVIVGPVRIL
jgi:membrane associated rhomboid family serine protease